MRPIFKLPIKDDVSSTDNVIADGSGSFIGDGGSSGSPER
jgi:hypothetical protein